MISKIKEYDGIGFIKEAFNNHLLLYVLFQISISGFTKKDLQFVREGYNNKLYNRIKKKYAKKAKLIIDTYKETDSDLDSNIIWFCWLQGLNNAPELVKKCYDSILKNADQEIVVVTAANYSNYVKIPDIIIRKWNNGLISNTHFSDILRLALLLEHGGTWIDSTIYVSKRIPDFMLESKLFLFQSLKPGANGKKVVFSNWYISAHKNNPILYVTYELLCLFWNTNNRITNYYIFHQFLQLSCDLIPSEYNNIPKVCNSTPHIMQLEFFDKFDFDRWEYLLDCSAVHKLSNKFPKDDLKKENTLYHFFINQ